MSVPVTRPDPVPKPVISMVTVMELLVRPLRASPPGHHTVLSFLRNHPNLELVSIEGLVDVLESDVQDGVTEVGCHPGYIEPGFESSYSTEREAELRTLCAPAARAAVEQLGIRLLNFTSL